MAVITQNSEKYTFRKSIVIALGFVFLLWLIRAVEDSLTVDLGILGILPRSISGLVGIFTAPLIHGSAFHLLSNTFPLIMLLIAVFYFYDKIATEVFIWIYIATGFWVWLVARQAYHIGSSGLVYGLAAFLFFSGIFRRDARSMAVALVIAFIHGGMVQGLVPGDSSISWESHLMGSAAGIFCSFYFRKAPVIDQQNAGKITENGVAGKMSSTFSGYEFISYDNTYAYISRTDDKKKDTITYNLQLNKATSSEI